MFLYIVLTPISTTSGLRSTGNTRKYQQIDVYIYQCVNVKVNSFTSHRLLLVVTIIVFICGHMSAVCCHMKC